VAPGDRTSGTVTVILEELRQGTPGAREELFRIVYAELKQLAAAKMRRQPGDHTLQPTALVHEAYLRLMGSEAPRFEDRSHFFGSAARAMRSILVDFARQRQSLKRGGGRAPSTLQDDDRAAGKAPDPDPAEILAVHEALEKLEAIDPDRSRVVELRFFGGLEMEEIAAVLGVAERTVYRSWNTARAWLFREMQA